MLTFPLKLRNAIFYLGAIAGMVLSFAAVPRIFGLSSNTVYMIQLNDDTINPVTAEYIITAIDKAYREKAQCLIIKLDTPGGLLSSTRLIVKKMLETKVPLVVYISPDGSRAGSAGVFITYASHIAAMAPSTNIGAAHPVNIGEGAPKKDESEWEELKDLIEELKKLNKPLEQQKDNAVSDKEATKKKSTDSKDAPSTDSSDLDIEPDEDPMASKILQDTVAFIKAIAETRGRNVDWALQSVVKSSSITSEEALEKGVIEIIAKDDKDLLTQLNGRRVKIHDEERILLTSDAQMIRIDMDARQRFLNILANPTIAYFLLILGFYGLLYEVTHPGIGVPGVLGFIFLILAFYSMQMLPTNYAGLALIGLGLCLLVAEVFMPGFGILLLGGLASLVLGSLLLFKTVDPVMRVSISAIVGFSLTTAAITFFLVGNAIRSHRAKVMGGKEGLMGEKGEARTRLGKGQKGKIFVHGELWNAVASEDIDQGDKVIVQDIEGLTLKVKKSAKEV